MRRSSIVLLAIALAWGCGARTEVAKDKVLKQIDKMLGEVDVKRKEIELSVNGLKDGIEGMRKAKIKAQVKREQMDRQVGDIQQQITQVDDILKKLRPHLNATTPVEISGTTYSVQQINEAADKLLKERKMLSDNLDHLHQAQASLDNTASTLEKRQIECQERLKRLEVQLAEIDTKSVALKAMQEASASMGDGDKSLASNLDSLEHKVKDLFATVETELRSGDEKWNETVENKKIDSADSLIENMRKPADTATEIDKILGGAGTKK